MRSTVLPAPEERLCIVASYARPGPAELGALGDLVASVRDWPRVAALALASGVAPLLWRRLTALGCTAALPELVERRLAQAAARAATASRVRLAGARPALVRLAAAGVPVAVVKGAFLGAAIHGDAGYKAMSDLDLLVRREDRARVRAACLAGGLRPLGGAAAYGHARAGAHHDVPQLGRDRRCVVDVQWAFTSPWHGYALDYAAIWARTRPFVLAGVALAALAPADQLHHLCLHLGRFKIAIVDLADLYNLVRVARGTIDWDELRATVRRAGTAAAVHRALALADRLCPAVETAELVRALAADAGWRARAHVRRRTASVERLATLGTDHLERIQRHFMRLRASDRPRLRRVARRALWRAVLLPPREVACRLGAPARRGGVRDVAARAAAPWRLLGALAAEVGWRRLGALVRHGVGR